MNGWELVVMKSPRIICKYYKDDPLIKKYKIKFTHGKACNGMFTFERAYINNITKIILNFAKLIFFSYGSKLNQIV